MGAWILFAALLALMLIHSKGTQILGTEQRDIKDRLTRLETAVAALGTAIDKLQQTLETDISEAVATEAIRLVDDKAEREEAALVPDTRAYTVQDEAA